VLTARAVKGCDVGTQCRLTAARIPRCRLESTWLSQSHVLQAAWPRSPMRKDLHRPWPSRMAIIGMRPFETFAVPFSPGT